MLIFTVQMTDELMAADSVKRNKEAARKSSGLFSQRSTSITPAMMEQTGTP